MLWKWIMNISQREIKRMLHETTTFWQVWKWTMEARRSKAKTKKENEKGEQIWFIEGKYSLYKSVTLLERSSRRLAPFRALHKSLPFHLYQQSEWVVSPTERRSAATEREDGGHRTRQTHHNPHLHLASLGNRTARKPLRETSAADRVSSSSSGHRFCFRFRFR